MRLRLTRTAARQLDYVLEGIAQHGLPGARNVQKRIHAVMHMLLEHPYAGQATARRGIRRMIIAPYPYILTYRVGDGEIIVRTIRHTARRPLV